MTTSDLQAAFRELRAWQAGVGDQGREPMEHYPAFDELRQAAISALAGSDTSRDAAAQILEVLGYDSEAELVLDALSSSAERGLPIALAGLDHPSNHTRWQVAEALGRFATPIALDALQRLLNDDDEYVRRRALLALRPHDASAARTTALAWLTSHHEYSRLVALDTLAVLGDSSLPKALAVLKNDPSEHVRARACKITASR